jgi:hypothetical protein
LSRGLVGEDNAALLGSLLVTKIQLGAMSRADIPAEERSPFYLYVDEFQNFATDSFAVILSEARKYGLNLTVANQYIAQMSMEVKDAVFGNVGSIIAFRMGADDAGGMMRYFEPKFEEYDLVHMHNRHFVISLTIEGEKVPAFSAISLNLPPQQENQTDMIIERSRAQYAVSRAFVERYVNERYLSNDAPDQRQAKREQPVISRPKTVVTPNHVGANTLKAAMDKADKTDKTAEADGATPAKVTAPQAPAQQPTVTASPPTKPKRKRTRNRKPRTADAQTAAPNPTGPQNMREEGSIDLR